MFLLHWQETGKVFMSITTQGSSSLSRSSSQVFTYTSSLFTVIPSRSQRKEQEEVDSPDTDLDLTLEDLAVDVTGRQPSHPPHSNGLGVASLSGAWK